MKKKIIPVLTALLAATLYALNIPASKILLTNTEPVFQASFLYLGAGLGMGIFKLSKREKAEKFRKNDYIYVVGMVLLDIAAPILLMLGLSLSPSENASLLGNFEIVATSLIALLVFREKISPFMWIAVSLMTVSSFILSFDPTSELSFSVGSLLILGACVCWGLENNCTKMISERDTADIVLIKGIFSGLGSFIVALISGESLPEIKYIIFALLLGSVSYGLSIFLYVRAQRSLGAAGTSAYYSVNPFIGAALSLLIFKNPLSPSFFISLAVMIAGTAFAVCDSLKNK